MEQHFGPDHSRTAMARSNLAWALLKLGDPRGARRLLLGSLDVLDRFFGPGHVETSEALANLAIASGQLGNTAEERSLLERCLLIEDLMHCFPAVANLEHCLPPKVTTEPKPTRARSETKRRQPKSQSPKPEADASPCRRPAPSRTHTHLNPSHTYTHIRHPFPSPFRFPFSSLLQPPSLSATGRAEDERRKLLMAEVRTTSSNARIGHQGGDLPTWRRSEHRSLL